MAMQVLNSYCAHDVSHDLESAVWLLLCTVLRHTLQITQGDDDDKPLEWVRYDVYRRLFAEGTTEAASYEKKWFFVSRSLKWEVKDNEPLTALIRNLQTLVKKQNREPEMSDENPVPLTYRSVLTEFNRALASPDWPENDAALPFTLTRDNDSSESRGKKRAREPEEEHADLENDASSVLPQREAKRPMVGPSPLRNQVVGDPLEEDLGDE